MGRPTSAGFGNGIAGCWLDGDAGCSVIPIVLVSMSWAHGYAGKGYRSNVALSLIIFPIQSVIRQQHWTFKCWDVGIALLGVALCYMCRVVGCQ